MMCPHMRMTMLWIMGYLERQWQGFIKDIFIDNMAYLPYTKCRKRIGDYNG